jgi:hypothetical protein
MDTLSFAIEAVTVGTLGTRYRLTMTVPAIGRFESTNTKTTPAAWDAIKRDLRARWRSAAGFDLTKTPNVWRSC